DFVGASGHDSPLWHQPSRCSADATRGTQARAADFVGASGHDSPLWPQPSLAPSTRRLPTRARSATVGLHESPRVEESARSKSGPKAQRPKPKPTRGTGPAAYFHPSTSMMSPSL